MADTVHHPLAFCRTCGPFPVALIELCDSSGVVIGGGAESCPSCGHAAEVIPGRYDSFGAELRLLVDPGISPEALAALRRIAEQAQAGQITADEAKAEAERVAPGTGRLFDVHNWPGQAKATLYASIIGAASLVGAAYITSGPTQTVNLHPVIERVIEGHLRSSTSLSPTGPVPRPRPKPRR